jgi:polyhydroxybutyrate depolymerase
MAGTTATEKLYPGILVAFSLFLASCSLDDSDLSASSHQYPLLNGISGCMDDPRGVAGRTDKFRYAGRRLANVIAPANYRADRTHPLVVVYAPAGYSASYSERLHRFTSLATERGYIIAYAGNPGLNMNLIEDLHRLPEFLAENWCIDENRVFVTGHSDGGTTAIATVLLQDQIVTPTGIVASAFGFSKKDLDAFSCPSPVPMLLFQNMADELFPGYVEIAAEWLAKCADCKGKEILTGGFCSAWSSCSEGVEITFCENPGRHADSPLTAAALLDFFDGI